MLSFFIKRIAQSIIVMLAISFIAFAIQNNLGDPVKELVSISASEAEKAQVREQLGLDDPFVVRYTSFIRNMLHGDFGTSYFFKEPTAIVILKKLPATLELVFAATLIIIVISVPAGIYASIYPKTLPARLIMAFSAIGISIPVFLTGIMLIYVFSIGLGWMPAFGRGDTVILANHIETSLLSLDGLLHLVMPAFTLASIMLPLFIRLIRSQMMEILQSEYIKFAYAKGLKLRRIYFIHAFKNTLLPVISVGGVQIGTMVAYTILTETVFQWPGMGFMFLEAINRSDIPLITTYLIFVGFIFIVVNTIVDLIYILVNPNIKFS